MTSLYKIKDNQEYDEPSKNTLIREYLCMVRIILESLLQMVSRAYKLTVDTERDVEVECRLQSVERAIGYRE